MNPSSSVSSNSFGSSKAPKLPTICRRTSNISPKCSTHQSRVHLGSRSPDSHQTQIMEGSAWNCDLGRRGRDSDFNIDPPPGLENVSARAASISGQALNRERLWKKFFSDPSQWLDNRLEKKNSKSPDFKHKSSSEALWIESWLNPPWVKAELARLAEGQAQLQDSFTCAVDGQAQVRQHSWCMEPIFSPSGGVNITSVTSVSEQRIKDSHSSNKDIRTLCQQGCLEEAVQMLDSMDHLGLLSYSDTFLTLVQQCIDKNNLVMGKHVHAIISKSGCKPTVDLSNNLINMYAKSGKMEDAFLVFNTMTVHDVVSWTTLISGCVQHGNNDEALELFQQMQGEKMEPDEVAFICALKACRNLGNMQEGKKIHAQIVEHGFELEFLVGSTLVDMYANCGSLEFAGLVFDKVAEQGEVPWNAMISCYAQHDDNEKALKLYEKMQQAGTKPDAVTFVSVLNACAHLAALEQGICIHAQTIEHGLESNVFVGSTLIDMYFKSGNMECAQRIFAKMPDKDVVSWNTIITGLSRHGCSEEAVKIFKQMLLEGIEPNRISFISTLNACASLAALEEGENIHAQVRRWGFQSDMLVASCLVDMYCKCGNTDKAREVFDGMHKQDVISWTAMIAGYARNGACQEALQLGVQMHMQGLEMDHLTYTEILTACNHAGQVDAAHCYFDSMTQEYGITHTAEHYACMIDAFGRAGLLDEAVNFIRNMPVQPNAIVWMALLGACRVSNNVELAELVAEQALKLEPQKGGAYVLLSNIYGTSGKWKSKSR